MVILASCLSQKLRLIRGIYFIAVIIIIYIVVQQQGCVNLSWPYMRELLRNMIYHYVIQLLEPIKNLLFLPGNLQAEVLLSLEDELISHIPFSGECLIQGKSKVWIGVSRAEGLKCERCWNFSPQVGSFSEHPTLCNRCYNVVDAQPLPAVAMTS